MIVNLNRYRKARKRALEVQQAAENRIRFGRPGEMRKWERREQERAETALEGKRLDSGDDPDKGGD